MKKLFVVLCMLTCIFATTACGSEKEVVEPKFIAVMDDAEVETAGGMELLIQDMALYYFDSMVYCAEEDLADVYAFQDEELYGWLPSATTSYNTALEDMGSVNDFAFTSPEEYYEYLEKIELSISEKEVIATIPLEGELKNASVEIIFNEKGNVTSMTTNVERTFGELMTNAALNTLLGMGTVFAGLICLVVLISLLNLIFNKIPEKQPVKEETKAAAAAVADEKMDDETVAAVSAAIAEVLGRDVSGIRITSIKKIN